MSEMSEKKRHHRKALLIGAGIGAVLSLFISLMMDVLASGQAQGTWRDAIVNDLDMFMSITISPDSAMAYVLFLLVMVFMAAIGGAIGALFSYIVFRFLEMLAS